MKRTPFLSCVAVLTLTLCSNAFGEVKIADQHNYPATSLQSASNFDVSAEANALRPAYQKFCNAVKSAASAEGVENAMEEYKKVKNKALELCKKRRYMEYQNFSAEARRTFTVTNGSIVNNIRIDCPNPTDFTFNFKKGANEKFWKVSEETKKKKDNAYIIGTSYDPEGFPPNTRVVGVNTLEKGSYVSGEISAVYKYKPEAIERLVEKDMGIIKKRLEDAAKY